MYRIYILFIYFLVRNCNDKKPTFLFPPFFFFFLVLIGKCSTLLTVYNLIHVTSLLNTGSGQGFFFFFFVIAVLILPYAGRNVGVLSVVTWVVIKVWDQLLLALGVDNYFACAALCKWRRRVVICKLFPVNRNQHSNQYTLPRRIGQYACASDLDRLYLETAPERSFGLDNRSRNWPGNFALV